MPRHTRTSLSLSILAMAVASPALADVTAAELWAEWQTQSEGFGQTLSAAETVATGNGLTLRGVTTSFSDDDVSVVGDIAEMNLIENGDGTVSITMSDLYTLTITVDDGPSGDPARIEMNLSSEDLVITAGGTVDARSYDYTATSIMLEDGPLSGGDGPPPEVDARITMREVAGDYMIDGRDPDNLMLQSSYSHGSMDGFVDVAAPPDDDGRIKLSIAMGSASGSGGGAFGNYFEVMQDPEITPANFDLASELTYDRVSLEVNFRDGSDNFQMFYSNAGGSFGTAVSDTRLSYDVSAREAALQASGTDIPAPIDITVGSAEIAFDIPLAPGDGPSDVSARFAYQDVELGEPLWMMADPMQTVPRSPITMIIDVSGAVQLFVNLLTTDPTEMDAPPGELRALTVNELRIGAAGAELTGTGSATFAPDQMIPMPVGSIALQLSGGNALLDQLQQSGAVPPQELAMVRGMLGAFARPGASPDTMETTIEFTEGGGIIANGVPLQ